MRVTFGPEENDDTRLGYTHDDETEPDDFGFEDMRGAAEPEHVDL